jgi:hypothetical protein
MNIKRILSGLAAYLHASRRVGHTTAMIRGAQNTENVVVLAHTHFYASRLQGLIPGAKVVSMHSIESLQGRHSPLVVDNSALWDICQSALSEIERLEGDARKLSVQKDEAMQQVDRHKLKIDWLINAVKDRDVAQNDLINAITALFDAINGTSIIGLDAAMSQAELLVKKLKESQS